MNIKQKVISLLLIAVASVGIASVSGSLVGAVEECGGVDTSIIGGDICNGVDNESGVVEQNAIWKLLILVLNILTAGVGIAAVGGIVYASILYASAADKAEQTKKAIGIISNIVIGIVVYALMYLILNFLIPGGIFN